MSYIKNALPNKCHYKNNYLSMVNCDLSKCCRQQDDWIRTFGLNKIEIDLCVLTCVTQMLAWQSCIDVIFVVEH